VQVRLNYREPRITEPEPDGPDNLTEREPKFAMIASPAADDCKPLHLVAGLPTVRRSTCPRSTT
jgi:hypothetical protein